MYEIIVLEWDTGLMTTIQVDEDEDVEEAIRNYCKVSNLKFPDQWYFDDDDFFLVE